MTPPDDDSEQPVPISVRLGAVVPPEDPEDWTRPLTWVAALGMLAAPAILIAWYAVASPTDSARPWVGTYVVAVALAVGAAAAGATQMGRARAVTGTLAAGLLGALLVVIVGAVTAGEVGYIDDMHLGIPMATPNLAHAAAAALAGLAGCLPAALAALIAAGRLSRLQRGVLTAAIGAVVAALVLPKLF